MRSHAVLAQSAPEVTASANASPSSAVPGQTIQLTASVSSNAAVSALVDIEVYDPAGRMVFQRYWDNQSLPATTPQSYATSWKLDAAAPTGTYVVKVGVMAPTWGNAYTWNNEAAWVTVAAAAATPAATATPAQASAPTATPAKTTVPTATPGSSTPPQPNVSAGATVATTSATTGTSVAINAWATSSITLTAQVDVEVYNPSGHMVFQQFWDYQSLAAGVPRSYQAWWQIDSGSPTGMYTVKVGITAPKWGALYTWNNQAAQINVAATTTSTATAWPTATATVPPTPIAVPPQPVPTALSNTTPRLLFGLGTEAPEALSSALSQNAPVRMLSNWYNKPEDLNWLSVWKAGQIPQAYAAGYAMHLIVYAPDDSWDTSARKLWTKYGEACGRPYPLSDRFLDDTRQLAQLFAGPAGGPPLYVTLFTELQTYGCGGGAWNPDAQTNAYYRALKDRYMEALAVFHQNAPNAKVSLGWGGWQARNDDPATGAGRSMFQYFADVMRASDFQSFQAMQLDTNVGDVLAMTSTLGQYGPVLLAHYRPDRYRPDWSSQAVFNADMKAMLNDTFLSQASAAGLFGWSFMDDVYLRNSADDYDLVKAAVWRYGANSSGTTTHRAP
jgi:hypothetical protein